MAGKNGLPHEIGAQPDYVNGIKQAEAAAAEMGSAAVTDATSTELPEITGTVIPEVGTN